MLSKKIETTWYQDLALTSALILPMIMLTLAMHADLTSEPSPVVIGICVFCMVAEVVSVVALISSYPISDKELVERLGFKDQREQDIIEGFAQRQELSISALFRQAMRHYQHHIDAPVPLDKFPRLEEKKEE